ncbi:uncharacterized protein MAM_03607 [Metarhizium album ARSEF 1941]|uniref:Uncharacterized protein n=1 Tax=Metarhizium album (strain ARSEF 1941) TaxID=1081103 RepID=A0A0B2WWP0_METAS|nr:uncharacterized protein MAM_03607 [Metarhizium album ARSEF 1941]KHN98483.1 hypothetical protein MAM_03607 [Metarhizium album ARSEF 1941]
MTPIELQPGLVGATQEAMLMQRLSSEPLAINSTKDENARPGGVSARAPVPQIPHPLDDGGSFHEDTSVDSEPEDEESARPESIHEKPAAGVGKAPDQQHTLQRLSALHRLPAEIRLAIYKILLVSSSPIRVHSGWRCVFKRQSLGIPTSILRTCQRVYDEAVGVLYGANVFLYKLRDHVSSVTDVDRLAHIDDADAVFPINGEADGDYDAEDEDDPEWREETSSRNTSRRRTTRRRGSRATDTEGDINIQKHALLFRHIVVEAERNRSVERTKKLMANALSIFNYRDMGDRRQVFNIHTLTIRVTPEWEPPKGEEGSGHYTFVDFFNRESPVMKAVQGIHCQFLLVDLMGCCRYGDAYDGRELKIDMRHLRLKNEVNRIIVDRWKGDRVMQVGRVRRAKMALHALATLEQRVAATCEECLEQTGRGDEWDDFTVMELDDEGAG